MKNKLQLNVDELDKFTVEELRQQVDQAIGQVNLKQIFTESQEVKEWQLTNNSMEIESEFLVIND